VVPETKRQFAGGPGGTDVNEWQSGGGACEQGGAPREGTRFGHRAISLCDAHPKTSIVALFSARALVRGAGPSDDVAQGT
jgi:hypothetical protein